MTNTVAQPTALYSNTAITTALTGVTGSSFNFGAYSQLSLYSIFTYGSGGTTAKAWVQASYDGGTTWMDIANFAATTASKTRAYNLTRAAVTSIATPADASLADDTSVNGFLGPLIRVKVTTTGTYAATTWAIYGFAQ